MTFTDTKGYFVSEASVYRLLKAHDLITSPAFVVIKAADEFRDKTAARTNCGRPTSPTSRSSAGAFYLSTILDDFSRYIIPGSCAPPCGLKMSPTRSSWPSKRQVAAARRSFTNPGSSATTARNPTSPAILQPGLRIRVWITSAAHRRHPQTQGKIERWHQTLKNRVLLENYYCRAISRPASDLRRALQPPPLATKASPTSPPPTSTLSDVSAYGTRLR